MVYVNKEGYLERKTRSKKNPHGKGTKRAWWLVKYGASKNSACIGLSKYGNITFPKKLLGKRIKLKVEVL